MCDQSDDNCSSVRSSTVASGDDDDEEPYLLGPEVDFVTAVAAAAQQSGMTVVGSTVAPTNKNSLGKILLSEQNCGSLCKLE